MTVMTQKSEPKSQDKILLCLQNIQNLSSKKVESKQLCPCQHACMHHGEVKHLKLISNIIMVQNSQINMITD